MKKGSFNKVSFEMTRGGGYGRYLISAMYKGRAIKAHNRFRDMGLAG